MSLGAIMNTSTLTNTFDGEFNSFSSSPDGSTGLWQTSLMNGGRTLGGNGEQEYYSDSSVGVNPFSVQNGILNIAATPGNNALGLPYNSGVITTESSFNQLYGYFEIDAKMPAGQGLWPAFWLLPASGAWPPELDAFEVLGNDPSTLYFSTHSTVQATQGTALSVANVSSGFNVYGVMWGPQTVDLYINSVEVASMPTPADMNVPMYMLANLAVGGYWPGNPNSSTVFPANMQIAYIKAFAYPGTTGGTVYDTLPSQNVGPAALAPVISTPASVQAATGVATSVGAVSVAANWPGGVFTVTVSDTQGRLQTSATTGILTFGAGTTSITLTGNLAPINAELATLTYQGMSIGNEEIWISAKDPQGLQGLKSIVASDVASITSVTPTPVTPTPVTPTPVTAPPVTTPVVTTPPVTTPSATVLPATTPVVNTPANFTLAAGTTEALSGINAMDSQMTGNATVVISDASGLLRTNATSGVTEQGEGSAALTLSGSLTDINSELATLTYLASAATGADWLWVSAQSGTAPQGLNHVVVTVTAAAIVAAAPIATAGIPPVVNAPAGVSIAAGVTQALSGVGVTDSQTSGSLSVVLSDSSGILDTSATSGVTELGENSTALTLTGSLTAINTELTSLTYKAGAGAGADWLWISATDAQGNQTLGHTLVTVTPAPVAVKPVVNTPATVSVAAGAARALSGVSVTDSQPTGTFSTVVSDSTGLLTTRATAGVTENGEGTTSLTLTGGLAAINAELASLTYKAGAATGTDWLWVSANDSAGDQGISPIVVSVTPAPVTPAPVVTTPVVTTPVVNTPASFALTASASQALTGVSVTDGHPSGNLTVKISDSTGLLNASATSGVTSQGQGSTTLTLTGSVAAINTELTSLTYQAGASEGTDWLWVSANDPNGTQGVSPVVVTVAPARPNATVQLTGVMLRLPNTAMFVRATLTDNLGLLATTAGFGVTATGEKSTHLVLQGIASSVNAELATLTYTGNASYPVTGAADSLTIDVMGASGGHLMTSMLPLLNGRLSH